MRFVTYPGYVIQLIPSRPPVCLTVPGTIYGEVLRVRANCKVLRPYRLYKQFAHLELEENLSEV